MRTLDYYAQDGSKEFKLHRPDDVHGRRTRTPRLAAERTAVLAECGLYQQIYNRCANSCNEQDGRDEGCGRPLTRTHTQNNDKEALVHISFNILLRSAAIHEDMSLWAPPG